MAQIYQKDGASLYDNNGQTIDAHTGLPYQPPAPVPAPAPTETTPAPAPAPINRTIADPSYDAANTYLTTFKQPESADQIAERKRKDSQALIDSINNQYNDQVAAAKVRGDQRVSQTDATSVLSGLMGSTEAGRTRNETTTANQKEVDAVNNQRALALAQVYTKITGDAEEEARQQVTDATKNAQDIVDRRTKSQSDAVANLKTLASGGLVDFDSFKNSPQNAKVYQYALDSVGGSEDALRAMFAINRPQDQVVGTPTRVGDHFVQAYKNPITGKVSFDNIPLPAGMGTEYKTFQKLGDNLVAIPDGWDGDVSKLKTIAGTPGNQTLSEGEALIGPDGKLIYKNAKTFAPKTAGAGGTGGGANGVSPELEQAIQNGLIDPNKVNSRTLGIYNDLAKAQIDTAGAHAGISGNTKAYEDATRYATTATRVVNVLEKNMPLLATLADKVNQTGVPGLDSYIAGVKAYTGNNQDLVKYISTLKTLRSEYAQMLSRGAAVTESDKAEASQAIPAGLSGANYLSLKSQLQLEGNNIIDTANETKNSLFQSTQDKNTPASVDDLRAKYGY